MPASNDKDEEEGEEEPGRRRRTGDDDDGDGVCSSNDFVCSFASLPMRTTDVTELIGDFNGDTETDNDDAFIINNIIIMFKDDDDDTDDGRGVGDRDMYVVICVAGDDKH